MKPGFPLSADGTGEVLYREICTSGEQDTEEQDNSQDMFCPRASQAETSISAGTNQTQECKAAEIPVVGGRHRPRARIGDILHSPGWDTTGPHC